jgi:hypothetical protein
MDKLYSNGKFLILKNYNRQIFNLKKIIIGKFKSHNNLANRKNYNY